MSKENNKDTQIKLIEAFLMPSLWASLYIFKFLGKLLEKINQRKSRK